MLLTLSSFSISFSFFFGHLSRGDNQRHVRRFRDEIYNQVTAIIRLSKSGIQVFARPMSAFHKADVGAIAQYLFCLVRPNLVLVNDFIFNFFEPNNVLDVHRKAILLYAIMYDIGKNSKEPLARLNE